MDRAQGETKVARLNVLAEERRALFGEFELHLTAREFDILARLAERPGWVLSDEQLADEDYLGGSSPNAVNVHVSHLRAKLTAAGAPPDLIETVRGVGWRVRRDGTGRLSPEQAAETVGLAIARARRRAAHMEFEEAIVALDEALECVDAAAIDAPRQSRVRSAIFERRGAARSALQDWANADADYRKALELRPANDHLAKARLHTRIAYVSLFDRSRGAVESALAQARAEFEQQPERDRGWWRAWIEIRLQQAQTLCLTDLPLWDGEGSKRLGEVVEVHGTTAQRARYHLALSDTLFYEARWSVTDACLEEVRRAVDDAMRADSLYVQALAIGQLGSLLVFAGNYSEAEIRLRQAIELAERCRDPLGVAAATMFLSVVARLECDVRRAERHALDLRSLLAARPSLPELDCTALGQLAWVALKRGNTEEAAQLSDEAITLWERDPSMSQSVWVMGWPALVCALAVGDVGRAVECATLMTRPDQQVLADDLDQRCGEAARLFWDGEPEAAEALLRELEAKARTLGYA